MQWTANFDRLSGAEKRRQRYQCQPRYGLTVTDGMFMSSRNGQDWHRFPEAYMRPGPERPNNWVYGDCYPARGLVTTPRRNSSAARIVHIWPTTIGWQTASSTVMLCDRKVLHPASHPMTPVG